jgi:hypothetical protein
MFSWIFNIIKGMITLAMTVLIVVATLTLLVFIGGVIMAFLGYGGVHS